MKIEVVPWVEVEPVKNRKFHPEFRKISEYVASRHRELRDHPVDCDNFAMPGDEVVGSLLSRVQASPTSFPGRRASNA